MGMQHERKVEKFYSTGSGGTSSGYCDVKEYDESFLNFGYWEKETKTYSEAARNLVNFFIDHSGIKKTNRILNVACGYGSETFTYYDKFRPSLINGVDLTKMHVDCANKKAKALNLNKHIVFHYADAVALKFPGNTFSHIFGIEGPANFNTREKFFSSANRVLKNRGEMVLADTILGKRFNKKNRLHLLILKFAAKYWVVPKANWVTEERYKKQLKDNGFSLVFFKKIGNKVFPGYAKNVFNIKMIKERISRRGIMGACGLSIISLLLGYLHKMGFIDYIYLKARKMPC